MQTMFSTMIRTLVLSSPLGTKSLISLTRSIDFVTTREVTVYKAPTDDILEYNLAYIYNSETV